jgi:hypothetical protein
MSRWWPRLLKICLAFAFAGWVASCITLSMDDNIGVAAGISSGRNFKAAAAAALTGLAWAPLVGRERLHWGLGAVWGLLAVPAAVFLNFLFWPTERWKLPAWKMAGLYLTTYPGTLIAAGVLGGLAATWLCRWRREAQPPTEAEDPLPPPSEEEAATEMIEPWEKR